jgi:cytochrome c peroxidase
MKPPYLICFLVLLLACKGAEPVTEPVEPEPEPKPLFYTPTEFGAPVYEVARNPVTPAGFELGKTLFYDGLLSRDKTIACGECHRQYYGFTHHLHDLSHGIDNRTGLRNAQPLQNLAWEKSFLWDGAVTHLDDQPVVPITHPDEMDFRVDSVVARLRKHPTYPGLFRAAFGTEEVTSERTMRALSQFMLSLISVDSKYDRARRGTEPLTPDEAAGLQLFEQKGCASCHAGPLFTDGSFRNNGLPPFERTKLEYVNGVPLFQRVMDEGRARVTGAAADRFKFRVPSLRNIAATLPYTHDGRFQTLSQVLDHYASGVQDSPTLDPLLKQNGRLGIPLSADEKTKIIAFLRTLTDPQFLSDPRAAEPPGFPVR